MAVNDNARYAYDYLQKKYKLTPAQAAGVVGNLVQESGLNTGARNAGDGRDGSDSIGIAQWNGQRARNLKAFGGDNYNNLDTQLDFVMHEMSGSGGNGGGSEAGAWSRLQKADDVHGATSAFIGFERPQGWSADNPTGGHGFGNRMKFAGQLFGMSPEEIASATPSIAPVAMATPRTQEVAAAASDTSKAPVEAEKKEGLFGLKLPEKVLGVDTKKGLNVLGALNTAMEQSTQQQNQAIQQGAQAAQARRGGSAPVQIVAQPSALFGDHAGASPAISPDQIELLKKKMMMSRRGGLGGLGGFGRA